MRDEKIGAALIGLMSLALFCYCAYHFFQPNEQTGATLAPPPVASKTPEQNVECAVRHYKNQKYRDFSEFVNLDGETVKLGRKTVRDEGGLFRAEGVLVYPDGESETFSVGIIYGDGAWSKKSATKINRRYNKRDVNIETVLDHDDIAELATENDYVIALGLASNEDDLEHDQNLKLAYARAHNLGLAVHRLGWQPTDRIWPNTLGYATKQATSDTEELAQRPVMLIGANARRPVNVSDVTYGAVQISPQDRVMAENYFFATNQPQPSRELTASSSYLEVEDITLIKDDSEYVPQILPAVEQQDDADEPICDEG